MEEKVNIGSQSVDFHCLGISSELVQDVRLAIFIEF